MKVRHFIFTVFIFFLTCISGCSPKTAVLKIGTFNNQCDLFDPELWPDRLPLVRELFDEYQFDVIGMQEPFWNQMQDLEKLLPEYAWVGLSTDGKPSEGTYHYNPIFYRKDRIEILDWGTFWFSETPDIPASKSWDTNTSRFCTWARMKDLASGAEFYEFNAHFDHRGELARLHSAEMIVDSTAAIAGSTPFFFNGDLNTDQSTAPYRVLAEALADTYHSAPVRENADIASWNDWKAPRHTNNPENIDHLFISPGTKALSWTLCVRDKDGLYASDHFPILVEWEIPIIR